MTNIMKYFERKAYRALKVWKEKYADQYAVLLEGARRTGKSVIAEHFARQEYDSYILIDFSHTVKQVIDCFDDIGNLDLFFLRLQAACGVQLIPGRSVIVFDEVQKFPKAREAVKFLVKDGRYHYIETGSLISIKKNVRDIVIPSEEMKINVYPLDYEEFCLAVNSPSYELGRQFYDLHGAVGQQINRKLMRDFRIYMAVGGMPQAVDAYLQKKSFAEIDVVKREILNLYEEDFYKIDRSGRISAMYHAIPALLAKDVRRYRIGEAIKQRKTDKNEDLLYDLIDSRTVLISYNSTDPRVSLSSSKDLDSYKLYLADTGLFVTLLFNDRPAVENELYTKLLSDRLPANLGYLYENAAAQMIAASDRKLYYHTWDKKGSTHYYEIDFLITEKDKVSAVEVKSSGTGKHESLTEFQRVYKGAVAHSYLFSQKDVMTKDQIQFLPIYMMPYILQS